MAINTNIHEDRRPMKAYRISIYFLLIALFGCEKEDPALTLKGDPTPAVITSTAQELSVVISEEQLADERTISWNETDYGIATEVNYTIEADLACNNFSSPVTLGSTTGTSLKITLDLLNTKLLTDLKLPQHLSSDVSVRIISKIRDQFAETSEPVTFTVSPWSAWPRGLWLTSDAWTDPLTTYEVSESAYDGYVYLNSGDVFIFADRTTCGLTTFGGSSGQLSEGSSEGIAVTESGHYQVRANTNDLTYELTRIESFGAVGSATPGGWDSSTPLVYDPARMVWEGTMDLLNGALKFRANDEWTINYGPADPSMMEGTLLIDDPGAISIPEPGNYTVTADFSKTKSPDFTYIVTKNSDEVAPLTLWVPGEYQGWSPGTAPTIKALNADVYEGYVYISSPTGYKFTSAPDWDHINYGDAGTEGALTTDGLANGMGLSVAGVYKFNVNVTALTYTAVLINSMGMVGPATAGGSDAGWSASVPMNYDAAEDVWRATIDLSPGALKFRANDEWTINYGPADTNALEGTLLFDDPGAINIVEAGNYTVTVDFSRSASPYKYTYSVVKN